MESLHQVNINTKNTFITSQVLYWFDIETVRTIEVTYTVHWIRTACHTRWKIADIVTGTNGSVVNPVSRTEARFVAVVDGCIPDGLKDKTYKIQKINQFKKMDALNQPWSTNIPSFSS